MLLKNQWRKMDSSDICCNNPNNLLQDKNYDGSLIDGGWICSVCGKNWVGNGKNEYLDHPLETLTKYGENVLKAINDVILERKHLCLKNVFLKMEN